MVGFLWLNSVLKKIPLVKSSTRQVLYDILLLYVTSLTHTEKKIHRINFWFCF